MKPILHPLGFSFSVKSVLTFTTRSLVERVFLYKKYFLSAILIGFTISIMVTVLAWLGHLRPYQNPLTNLLHLITHKKASDVVLLFITEEEYKQGFRGISPLSRKRLADTVNLLVKLKARVVALDIDISDPSSEDDKLLDALDRATAAGIPIVVVGNLKNIDEKTSADDDSSSDLHPYTDQEQHHTNEGFLVFEDATPGDQWKGKVIYGGVFFRLDTDGVFRKAEVLYMIKNSGLRYESPYRPIPSLPVAVAAAYQGVSQEALSETLLNIQNQKIMLPNKKGHPIPVLKGGRVIPNFIGNYKHFNREVNLRGLLEEYGSNQPERATIFKDKIVIVGGTFDKRDFYVTPVGRMSGMEILANITQNIISGNLIAHTSFWKAFIIQVILGIAVALVFIFTPRFWATVICFMGIVPVVVIASLWSFSASYYWFDFIPTIAGVMLYGWVIKTEERLKKVKRKLNSSVQRKMRGKKHEST
jgi:CHASE2 domain-containing sensor protein